MHKIDTVRLEEMAASLRTIASYVGSADKVTSYLSARLDHVAEELREMSERWESESDRSRSLEHL